MNGPDDTGVDWQSMYFDPSANWPARLQALAQRRFGATADADAACNFALDEVSRDSWRRLANGYEGRGSADGFMAITLRNLLEEYAVRKYGRKRPPTWVARLGTMWKRVHQMLCLQRLPAETIVGRLCAKSDHAPADVRHAIREVKARVPNCGAYVGEFTMQENDDPDLHGQVEQHSPADRLAEDEAAMLFKVLRALVSTAPADKPMPELSRLQDCLAVSDQERLLLRLVYHEGMTLPRAAKALRLHEQKARRTLKAVLARLRQGLADNGF